MGNKGIRRRAFLRMLAGTIACGYVGRLPYAFQSLLPKQAASLNGPLSFDTFAALLGETFCLSGLDSPGCYRSLLQLKEINSLARSSINDQFYLVFQADSATDQLNGVYQIQHLTAGSMQIFLQSMGNKMPGHYLRAEFNLLL